MATARQKVAVPLVSHRAMAIAVRQKETVHVTASAGAKGTGLVTENANQKGTDHAMVNAVPMLIVLAMVTLVPISERKDARPVGKVTTKKTSHATRTSKLRSSPTRSDFQKQFQDFKFWSCFLRLRS